MKHRSRRCAVTANRQVYRAGVSIGFQQTGWRGAGYTVNAGGRNYESFVIALVPCLPSVRSIRSACTRPKKRVSSAGGAENFYAALAASRLKEWEIFPTPGGAENFYAALAASLGKCRG